MAAVSATMKGTIGELPDDWAMQAGHLFVRCSLVEHMLEHTIWLFAGLDSSVGTIITRRMDLTRKLQRVDELIELKKPAQQLLDWWIDAKTQINIVQEKRNLLAHSVVLSIGDVRHFLSGRNAKRGEAYKWNHLTLDDIKTAIGAAESAVSLIGKICDALAP